VSTPPCPQSYYNERLECYVVCAGALSQELARQLSSTRLENRPWKVGPGGGTRLCGECADNLTLIVGNVRAVREEWGVD
jgi:hypothetical protein